MSQADRLRELPAVNDVLKHPSIDRLRAEHSHTLVTQWARAAIQACRERLIDGKRSNGEDFLSQIIADVQHACLRDQGQSIQHVINGTGVILHTNLGRAPLASLAIERAKQAASYTNVELDLQSGRRNRRGDRVTKLLAQLTGAEAAVVVNNCAAATVLVLQSIASGREVIVSRGQLVEIGGGFRLPDVFRTAGVTLREVGTTNRTYLRDYESAISEQSGAIIRVHHSNFHLSGFVSEPNIEEMVLIDRHEDIPVIDDLGSGCVADLSKFGLNEPNVLDSVRCGADLTLFSGDKLFGGPQSGIVVGKERWIRQLQSNPLMRAFRVDKLTLAALEATSEIHLAGNAWTEIPTLRMLALSTEQIKASCEQLVAAIGGIETHVHVEIVPCQSQVGGGSIPGSSLDSFALRLTGPPPDRLANAMRSGAQAVQTRVSEDAVLIDLRTVAEDEFMPLAAMLKHVLRKFSCGGTANQSLSSETNSE